MRALITGITGFVGQYLAEHLLASGDEVVGCSFREPWSDEARVALAPRIPLLEWNLAEPLPESVRQEVERFAPQAIYHLAAISVPSECGSDQPSSLAEAVNVGGTQRIVELAQSLAQPPRLLLTSSAHVYAPVSPDSPIVDERAPLGPSGAYGKTKLAAEAVAWQAMQQGLSLVIVRAFQHSGPRQLPKFVLPEWAFQFATTPADQPIQVVTLESYFDLSDVRDVIRAYRLLLTLPATAGVYNVGSGRAVRSGDIFERLQRLAGQPRQAVQRHPGPRHHPVANIARLTRDTQWTPRIPLQQTIADTLAYFEACAIKR